MTADEADPRSAVAARLDRLPITRWHWRLTVLVGVAAFFDLYEILVSGVLGSVVGHHWSLDRTTKALLIGAPYFGMFVGAIVLGVAADRFGRRRVFMLNLAAYSVLSLIAGFSPNVETLIALRMCAGVFMGAELILVDTYLSEIVPRASRGRLIAAAYTIGFCGAPVAGLLGGVVVSKTHLLLDGWRWLLIFGGVGAMAVWILRRNLPESPRWLVAHGRSAEADEIVTGIERIVAGQAKRELPQPGPGEPEAEALSVSARDMFRGVYRRRTIMLWIFHPLQTVGYYGFASMVPIVLLAKGFTITASLGYTTVVFLGYPIGSALSLPLIERFERKYLIIAAVTVATALGFVFGLATLPWLIATAGILITLVNNVFSNSFHVYQAELFPTKIRSSAIGIPYALSRLTAALLPFGALALLARFGPVGVFTGSAVLMAVLCVAVAVLGPRTNGRSLESVVLAGLPMAEGRPGTASALSGSAVAEAAHPLPDRPT